MLKKLFTVSLFCFSVFAALNAQRAWWVYFTDKHNVTFDPYSYFAPEAIARRQLNHISLYDSTDFPVNENYLARVGKMVDTLGYASRWLNAVGVVASDEEIAEVQKLSFVKAVAPQSVINWQPAATKFLPDTMVEDEDGNPRSPGLQIDPLQGRMFAQNNHRGKGIVIAILDVGFHGADQHPAFSRIVIDNRIRAAYDFIRQTSDVYSVSADHGTMVLSCIAGDMHGVQLGLAPDATFLLARIAKEYGNQYRGEEGFLAGVEWADKNGASIINCSGGPNEESYFPEQMDGKTAIISRAAKLAARKGILVVAAAGNEGETYEPNLLPPSDADSVVTVTALNDTGFIAEYSSHGPTPDFRRKPDLSAPGTAIVAAGYGDQFQSADGTSFSAPLIAGFAACLMEMYPGISAMSVLDTLRKSASLYPYFDYAHGYGTPQASYFFSGKRDLSPTFSFVDDGSGTIKIKIDDHCKPDCCHKPTLLFYNLSSATGMIFRYGVIEVKDDVPLTINAGDFPYGSELHVSYLGYYATKSR